MIAINVVTRLMYESLFILFNPFSIIQSPGSLDRKHTKQTTSLRNE